MIVLGIDIGLTGAIVKVCSDGTWAIGDIPTLAAEEPSKKTKRRIDGRGLADLVRFYVPADEAALILIEDVQARPIGRQNGSQHGNSMQSQGSLMRSRGIVEGVLDVLRLPVKVVQPQAWKRAYGLLGGHKDLARGHAVALYPDALAHLKRKKDINRADALLIARYGLEALA
jgi:hypothetical protein